MRKLDAALGPIDHVLATLACLLAVFSIGMSLNNSGLALFFTVGIIVTATSGYALATLVRKTKFVHFDSYLWAVLGVLAIGMVNVLNGLLPEEGFPFELLAAGGLCWLLLVGNLFAWRDQTLLFLSLPCIAIFGLVGTFDTFKPATVLFFVFMLTIALLYARIHQRAMIERAKRSGVEEPELLRRGPWKWMAGPEWALASALTIVLFSFMGGPVLQLSLRNVAGRVSVSLPQTRNNNNSANMNRQARSDVRIGTGPVNLSDAPVLKIKLDIPRYLRMSSYSSYTGSGWSSTPVTLPPSSPLMPRDPADGYETGPHGGILVWPGFDAPPTEPIEDGKVIPFTIKESNNYYLSVIAPGQIVEIEGDPEQFSFTSQGWVTLARSLGKDETLVGYSLVATSPPNDRRAVLPSALKPIGQIFLSKDRIPARVRDLAYAVTAGAKTDMDKAMAIKGEIERRAKYNIRATGVPRMYDPVDYFLFESREGYCDLFASSMAVMARSVGLPTRYVMGYIINEPERDEQGFFTVRGRDYHAWCEIYFEGIGWVPFDPTEGAIPVEGSGRGTGDDPLAWYQTSTFRMALLGMVVFGLLVPVVIVLRNHISSPNAITGRAVSEVAKLHAGFYTAIEKYVGSPKRFSQTTREYVDLVGPSLGALKPQATDLVGQFEAAMFATDHPEKSTIAEISAKVAAMRTALKQQKRNKA